ncbi:farnesyltranstransferase [Melanogaster broomeanus]|nr:farnesyltranstransferase [Melanogaster broomeanus]
MSHSNLNCLLTSLSTTSSQWSAKQEEELLEPFSYIILLQLIQAFNHWLQVPASQLEVITRVVGLLHNASLLVDDIEDDSELRRGRPVAHRIYGVPQTINTANYVYFLAFQEVSKINCLERPSFPSDDVEELLALHRGQGREILWRDNLRCPTEEEYIEMVKDKTGGLLRIAVRLMMECATANMDINYIPLVDLIGIWFQIRDDYMNLQSNVYAEHKGFAEDLSEGKFSFPIVHGIRKQPDNRQILSVLHQKPKSPTLKHHTISYLRDSTRSFEYTLSVLHSLEGQARGEVARLGGNAMLEMILDKLATGGSVNQSEPPQLQEMKEVVESNGGTCN